MYKFKYKEIYIFLFVLGLSLTALRYTPYPTDDGAYHFASAYMFSYYDNIYTWFVELMNQEIFTPNYNYNEFPLFGLLMYIFSKTETYSLISFTVAFATYYCYVYIIKDLYFKEYFSKFLFFLALIGIVLLNNFRYTTSGMRYCLAIGIMSLLLYKDGKDGYKLDKSLVLYLIPILIHPSIILYVILRIIYPFLKRVQLYKSITVVVIYPLILFLAPIVLGVIGGGYSESLISKILVYQQNSSYEELFNTTLVFRIYIGVLVSIMYILIYHTYIFSKKINKFYSFQTMTYYLSLLSIGMAPYQNLIDRHIFLLLPMILVSLLMYIINFDIYKNNQGLYYILVVLFIGFIITGIFYNKNYLNFISLMDFSSSEIFTKTLWEYFTDLPRYR